MANGVYHTGYGIEINLTREDLVNPGYDGLLEEITRPVGERPRQLLQCLRTAGAVSEPFGTSCL